MNHSKEVANQSKKSKLFSKIYDNHSKKCTNQSKSIELLKQFKNTNTHCDRNELGKLNNRLQNILKRLVKTS